MTKEWYPIIDYKKCIGCMACVEFCPHKVYSKKNGKPFVKNKKACLDGCKGCEKICPQKAITHFSKARLDEITKNITCGCGGKCK